MSKILIRETYQTDPAASSGPNVTVYIPGPLVSGATATTLPTLCTEASKVDSVMSGDSASLAKYLIKEYDMPVLAQGIENYADMDDLPDAIVQQLKDRSAYDVRFLTYGGKAICRANSEIVKIANARKDCVALISAPNKGEGTNDTAAKVQATIRAAIGTAGSTFAAGFTPNWKPKTGLDLPAVIPAAFAYLFAFGNMMKANNAPEYFAAAGLNNGKNSGVIPELASVEINYTGADRDLLQCRTYDADKFDTPQDNVGIAINPIMYVQGQYVVWGNRTCEDNKAISATKTYAKMTARSFLNIRHCAITVNKTMYDTATKYSYAQNSDTLWTNFSSEITAVCNEIQGNSGMLGYKLTKVATPDKKARLKAKVNIVPLEAVEDFDLELELDDSVSVIE